MGVMQFDFQLSGRTLSPYARNTVVPGATSPTQEVQKKLNSSLGQNHFLGKLEKHLDDVSKGKGYFSNDVPKELRSKALKNAELLSNSNPKAFVDYLALSSALTYDKKARFINSINTATENIARINQALENSDTPVNEITSPKPLSIEA